MARGARRAPEGVQVKPERPRYSIVDDGRAILCLVCHRLSYHPKDVRERYCGYCHTFHTRKEHHESSDRQA